MTCNHAARVTSKNWSDRLGQDGPVLAAIKSLKGNIKDDSCFFLTTL